MKGVFPIIQVFRMVDYGYKLTWVLNREMKIWLDQTYGDDEKDNILVIPPLEEENVLINVLDEGNFSFWAI